MLAGVLATPCLAVLLASGSSGYEGHAAIVSVGSSLAVLGFALSISRREGPTLSWHPVLAAALLITLLRAGLPLLAGRGNLAVLQLGESGRVILLLFLALQLVREEIQLEALGLAVAGGVIGFFGSAVATGIAPVASSPELQAHAAVAVPILLGFERSATRHTTRWAGRLAAVLALIAVLNSAAAAACAAAGLVLFVARRRTSASLAPRRDAVQHGVLAALFVQLLLVVTGFPASIPSGWMLIGGVAGACVSGRTEERLPASSIWLLAAPLAVWMVLGTAYVEARRLVGARVWGQARLALYASDFERAHGLLHQAADARASDAYTQIEAARVCLGVGDIKGAIECATRASELSPNDPDAMETMAMACMAGQRTELAAYWLQRLRVLRPDSTLVVDQLPRMLVESNQPALALPLLDEQIKTRGPSARRLILRGEALAATKDPGARAALEDAIKQYPTTPQGHIVLGQLLRATGKRKDAEASFRRALDLTPRHTPARVQLGLLLHEAGRPADSAAVLLEAALLDPWFPELRQALMDCLPPAERAKVRKEPNRILALKLCRIELEKTPDHLEIARVMAMDKAVTGDVKGATAELEKLVARAPKMVEAWTLLAYIHQKSGNADAARAALNRVRELAPPNSSIAVQAAGDLKALDQHH